METKTIVLGAHVVVALAMLGIGAISLLSGELVGFAVRLGTAGLVAAVGYTVYQTQ
ncbi:MAG: hypothetical protein ABEH77_01415 [Halobacteriaceae archaeon]